MRYSVQPRNQIFVRDRIDYHSSNICYGFLSFAKNMHKNISKNLSGKYSQKLLYHAKRSAMYDWQ